MGNRMLKRKVIRLQSQLRAQVSPLRRHRLSPNPSELAVFTPEGVLKGPRVSPWIPLQDGLGPVPQSTWRSRPEEANRAAWPSSSRLPIASAHGLCHQETPPIPDFVARKWRHRGTRSLIGSFRTAEAGHWKIWPFKATGVRLRQCSCTASPLRFALIGRLCIYSYASEIN